MCLYFNHSTLTDCDGSPLDVIYLSEQPESRQPNSFPRTLVLGCLKTVEPLLTAARR